MNHIGQHCLKQNCIVKTSSNIENCTINVRLDRLWRVRAESGRLHQLKIAKISSILYLKHNDNEWGSIRIVICRMQLARRQFIKCGLTVS